MKSSASPFMPSYSSTAVSSFAQHASPGSGRPFKSMQQSAFDRTNSSCLVVGGEQPSASSSRLSHHQLQQPSPFLMNTTKQEQPSPFLHMAKEEQPSPLLVSAGSHCPSRQDLLRPSNFKLSANSSFDLVNSSHPFQSSSGKDKIICKQEPVFLVSHPSTNATVTRSTTFPSPVVCRIPDTSMCMIQPSFISTANTTQQNMTTTYLDPGPPMTTTYLDPGPPVIIPQNICVHLPYGICSNNEMSCSRCYQRDDVALRTVVPAASIGRLHLSHMTYTTNGLTVSTIPTSSLHHTAAASSSSSFHMSN